MNMIEREIKAYRPRFKIILNHWINRLDADRIRDAVNSGVRQEDPLSCDWIILIILVICAFIFWIK